MSTYKLDELARETSVSARTIRYYVQRGLLPPPDFKGSQTTYGAIHRALLGAIKTLQARHWPLEQIAVEVQGKSVDALDHLAKGGNSTQGVSKKIGGSPYRHAPIETVPFVEAPARGDTWQRIELVPGVELHVKTDASPIARRLAREIQSNYGPYVSASKEEE